MNKAAQLVAQNTATMIKGGTQMVKEGSEAAIDVLGDVALLGVNAVEKARQAMHNTASDAAAQMIANLNNFKNGKGPFLFLIQT